MSGTLLIIYSVFISALWYTIGYFYGKITEKKKHNMGTDIDQENLPEIDFRKSMTEGLTREELVEKLCEINESHITMRKEWYNKVMMQK
jgi:hypothetical protein